MASAVLTAFHATPTPKIVVTVGDDANDEGLFKNCYAVSGRVSDIIPVHYHIPGDPPTPKDILYHLLRILEKVDCHIL